MLANMSASPSSASRLGTKLEIHHGVTASKRNIEAWPTLLRRGLRSSSQKAKSKIRLRKSPSRGFWHSASYPVPVFCRRRHQPRRPPHAKVKPGSPAPAIKSLLRLNNNRDRILALYEAMRREHYDDELRRASRIFSTWMALGGSGH
jgi:hypothetical protein